MPTVAGSWRKQGTSRKTTTSVSLTMKKPLTMDHNKLWQILRDQIILPVSGETCMQAKKQQLEPDMEQQTASKLGKEYDKAVYCHPACLTSMQSTSFEMPSWVNHKLE